ncbi:MAG: response regulator [Planctomycetes bacterium]|nr:response regulator [Planctomycetota bacterium]
MTLRRRTLLLLTVVLAALLGVLQLASSSVLLGGFRRVERDLCLQNLHRVWKGYLGILATLQEKASDWSYWDEMARFVQGRNETFVVSTLGMTPFETMRLSILAIHDASGNPVYVKERTAEPPELRTPGPRTLAAVSEVNQRIVREGPAHAIRGVLETELGTLLFASTPILRTDRSGPVLGTVTFGRLLDRAEVDRLAELTELPIELLRTGNAGIPNSALSTLSSGEPVALSEPEGDVVPGFVVIRDQVGRVSCVLRVVQPRSVYAAGLRSIVGSIAMALVLGAVLVAVVSGLLEGLVLRRLHRMGADVLAIGNQRDSGLRVRVEGDDELALLGRTINDALQALESANADLRVAKESADASSRAKAEFLARMSHEIRTPLNGVLGMTELALQGHLGAEQRGLLETVHSSANLLLDIVNDILDFSKIEGRKLQLDIRQIDLHGLVSEVVQLFRSRAERKGLTLNLAISDEVPVTVLGDGLRIRQILVNLIGNAVKFTERGAVSVQVGKIREHAGLIWIEFEVSDTGIGISKEQQTQIFEAFSQGETSFSRSYGGTGLGLAISARLAEIMGGELTVQSDLGVGATFRCTVSVSTARMIDVEEPAAALPGAQETQRSLRVLVVDDNAVNRIVASKILERAGHCVEAADNGKAALEVLRSVHFDLVLMDLQMPVMDGIETIRRIRAGEEGVNPKIRVIAITAQAEESDRTACLSAGADGFLTKPLRMGELLAEMNRMLAHLPS